ncbi:Uncharacterised protein [Mycobacteroides abscessus subsp. abscessus]|nr:Uncharacterised protein [Mycobacteroides abscessus subsp. abscessus]
MSSPGSISADSARRLNDPSSPPPTSATTPRAAKVIGRMLDQMARLSRVSRAAFTCFSTVSSLDCTV